MKNKVKAFLITLACTIFFASILTVIIEYTMLLNTKTNIELAKIEKEKEKDIKEILDLEDQYQKEVESNPLDEYDLVGDYYNGLAVVRKDGKYGYIDRNGKEIIPVEFDFASDFVRKYAKVEKNEKCGYIDLDGNVIIPIEYSYCSDVINDAVAVGDNGKYGFISIDGNKICDLMYDRVEKFNDDGLAKVVLNGMYGYIDKNGEVKVEISNPYVEINRYFVGNWKQTDVHSQKASTIVISGQTATSFDFNISAKYFLKSGVISGSADIVKPNVAEYYYDKGQKNNRLLLV